MGERRRIVVDTNVLISRLLAPASVPGRATGKALEGQLLVSEATLAELAEVLSREPALARRTGRAQARPRTCRIWEMSA